MEGRGECAAEEYYLCRPWWYKCFYAVSHEDNRGRLNEKKKKQDKYLFYLGCGNSYRGRYMICGFDGSVSIYALVS